MTSTSVGVRESERAGVARLTSTPRLYVGFSGDLVLGMYKTDDPVAAPRDLVVVGGEHHGREVSWTSEQRIDDDLPVPRVLLGRRFVGEEQPWS